MDSRAFKQLLENVDEKHVSGHQRLRRDLTEGLCDVHIELEKLGQHQAQDHEAIVRLVSTRERRKELSAYRAVIIAAAIGGGFRLIEVIINKVGQ